MKCDGHTLRESPRHSGPSGRPPWRAEAAVAALDKFCLSSQTTICFPLKAGTTCIMKVAGKQSWGQFTGWEWEWEWEGSRCALLHLTTNSVALTAHPPPPASPLLSLTQVHLVRPSDQFSRCYEILDDTNETLTGAPRAHALYVSPCSNYARRRSKYPPRIHPFESTTTLRFRLKQALVHDRRILRT